MKKLSEPLSKIPSRMPFLETCLPTLRQSMILRLPGRLSEIVYNTAKSVLGRPRKKHQDWFDENNQGILGLLAEEKAAHAA